MEEEYSQTFQVGPECEVEIQNIRGSTEIEAWDKPEVHIEARKRAGGHDEMTKVEIGQEGNKVWAKVRPTAGSDWTSWLSIRKPAAVDLVVKVPHQSHVATSMVSGTTKVKGVHHALKLSTVSGDVELEDVAGKVSLNSVSGDVAAKQMGGEIKLNTVSGDVVLEASDLTSIQGNTVSGDIRAETALSSEGKYTFSSVSGDVRLAVPLDTRCTAKMSTLSGDLRVALPHTVIEDKRTSKRYEINGGGVGCDFNSVSGDLRILAAGGEEREGRAEPQAEQTAAATEPSSPRPSRMQILKAIEAGEITVEEGLKRLQGLPFEE